MTIEQADKTYIANTYSRFPIHLVKGEGALLFDVDGKRYIDLSSGIGVNALGIGNSAWADAVFAQMKTLSHASNLFYTDPCVKVAEKLCTKSGMKKVFFCNSGAEANECAIKVARKWAAENKGEDYYNIITLKNSFHGRTLATLAATAQESMHKYFLPLTPGFVYVETGDIKALEDAIVTNKCVAVMLEMIQGEGGVIPLEADYVKVAFDLAKKHNILFIADEVQTGIGRTGKLYAYMHFGITPDIVTSAKGLGGGLPIGTTLFGERTMDTLVPGSHGSTFGGNPAVCAGAEVVLDSIDDNLLEGIIEKGNLIRAKLSGAKGIEQVTGMGLMVGVVTQRPVVDVLSDLQKEGVIALKAHDRLRLLPPLNIPNELLEEAITKIKKVSANI